MALEVIDITEYVYQETCNNHYSHDVMYLSSTDIFRQTQNHDVILIIPYF